MWTNRKHRRITPNASVVTSYTPNSRRAKLSQCNARNECPALHETCYIDTWPSEHKVWYIFPKKQVHSSSELLQRCQLVNRTFLLYDITALNLLVFISTWFVKNNVRTICILLHLNILDNTRFDDDIEYANFTCNKKPTNKGWFHREI